MFPLDSWPHLLPHPISWKRSVLVNKKKIFSTSKVSFEIVNQNGFYRESFGPEAEDGGDLSVCHLPGSARRPREYWETMFSLPKLVLGKIQLAKKICPNMVKMGFLPQVHDFLHNQLRISHLNVPQKSSNTLNVYRFRLLLTQRPSLFKDSVAACQYALSHLCRYSSASRDTLLAKTVMRRTQSAPYASNPTQTRGWGTAQWNR